MAILVKSTTALAEKNRLSTTWKAFRDAEALYGKPFSIDVCAEPETAKCPTFFCSPDWFESARSNVLTGSELVSLKGKKIVGFDALQLDWPNDWWCNPPFDRKQEFITHAHKQAKAGRSGMMLLPYEAITGWWRRLVEGKANAVYIPMAVITSMKSTEKPSAAA